MAVRMSWMYSLFVSLYTLFWLALSLIGYRTFLFDGGNIKGMPAPAYFFLIGLLLVVCGAIRNLLERQSDGEYDPISISLCLSGILLLLYANLAY